MCHVAPSEIKKECYLLRSCCWENVACHGWVDISACEGALVMDNVDSQWAVEGERGQKGRENFLCLNFLCLAITYELCFTRCSALLVDGIRVSIYFLSPAFLLLNQHRKFEKGNIHLTIHHPSTFLHLYSLLRFSHTSMFKQNENSYQSVHTICAWSCNIIL